MRFTIFLAIVSAAAVASAPVDERQPGETSSTSTVSSPPLPDETFSPPPPEGDRPHRIWRHHPRPQFDDPDSPPSPTPSETFNPPPSMTFNPTPLPSSSA